MTDLIDMKFEHRRESRRRVTLTATVGGRVLHMDNINPSSSKARASFVKTLVKNYPGADRQAVETEILQLADFCSKAPIPDESETSSSGSSSIAFASLKPWPEAVDGAILLSDIMATLHRYAVLPANAAEAMALWALFAHVHDAFFVSPILLLSSPFKRCGKSRVLELLSGMVPRPLPTSNITPAGLFRTVEKYCPTLLIDEFDSQYRKGQDYKSILNSGWLRSFARVMRTENGEPRAFSTWCPKAIAGIGMPWDTIQDRSIIIRIQRKGHGDKVERWRADRAAAILEPLARRAARWAEDHLDDLRDADPIMPHIASDRAADNWRPLIAVADAVGGLWPELARTAAAALSAIPEDDDSPCLVLLADLRTLFAARGVDRLSSDEVAKHLAQIEEHPWSEYKRGRPISMCQVAHLLKLVDVHSGSIRLPLGKTSKGYMLSDLEPVFQRYLPAPVHQSGTTAQARNDSEIQSNEDDGCVVLKSPVTEQDRACAAVPAEAREQAGFRPQHAVQFALEAEEEGRTQS
ncbi:MAG TPA: DUF3631 domain-containing protein [Myxococcota bacterium]|nr:DUF3631 domain-containing protein [Myxococcota bacterium]